MQEFRIVRKVFDIANIPIVLIIFDVLRGFVTSGVGTSETVLLLLYCFYFIIFKRGILRFNIWIPIFLVFTFLLGLYSSDTVRTFQNYSWVFISLMMMPIAYQQIQSMDDFRRLNRSVIILIYIFVINGLITAALGIGNNPYGGDFTMGAFSMATLYSGSIALMLLPIILPKMKKKINIHLLLLFSFILFLLLLLSMRRTAIIIPLLGYFIYFFYSSYKKQIILGTIGFVVVMGLTLPLYQDILLRQVASREHAFSDEYDPTEEGRYQEGFFVVNERYGNEIPWFLTLFGNEVFNSYGHYNNGEWGTRPLHVDFYKLLHTTGLIGFILYILIYLKAYLKYVAIRQKIPKNDTYLNEVGGVFVAIVLISLFISTQGAMYVIAFRALMFIYMGAIMGLLKQKAVQREEMEN